LLAARSGQRALPFIGQLERAAGFTRDDTNATKLDKLEALLGSGAEPGDLLLLTEMLSLSGDERFPPLDLSPQRKKERTLAALLRQLQVLARRQPILMIFEDLHWIDPTSREVLDLTIEKITGLPVLLVATYRPEFQPPWVGGSQDIGVSAFVILSLALWHRGCPDQSARAADRALAYSRQLGHAHTLAHALALAGMAAVFSRDVAAVHAYGNDCVALASEHGYALWVAAGRILEGWADAQRGEATTGIARIRDGLAASKATGTRLNKPLFLTLLAEALAFAGKIEEGLAALDDALAKAAVFGVKGWTAEIHRLRGELTGRLPYPDPAKAEDSFRTALATAREQGTRGHELRAATSLARLWHDQGRRGEARDLLAPVYDSFTEGFDTADLKDAKALLDELA
jgi:hypothetical protein